MQNYRQQNDHDLLTPAELDGLFLQCYRPTEVRQISVLEVTSTRTFDDVFF
jgi:D-alanyl-D-alanine dipeptidase